MRALFRVDSGRRIGGGHLFRCLVLADALAARGGSCAFACRPHEGSLAQEVTARGHALHELSAPRAPDGGARTGHDAWVGASSEQDAAETSALLEGLRPDWLVVDHYGLGAPWEQRVRAAHDGRMLVIDDLADRPHQCDLLLDQNLWPDAASRYAGLVPDRCRQLLGPRYALLRERSEASETGAIPAGTVLAFFGAVDATGECRKLAEAWLARYGGKDARAVPLRIIAGRLNGDLPWLLEAAQGVDALSVVPWVSDLAGALASARCAVGAAGSSTWERLAAGCESWVVIIAENQRALAAHLVELGIVRRIGGGSTTTVDDYRRCLREIEEFRPDEARRRLLREVCDGAGARRVADAMRAGGGDHER